MLLIITSNSDELFIVSTSMTLNVFLQFVAVAHFSTVNCNERDRDRLRQSAIMNC